MTAQPTTDVTKLLGADSLEPDAPIRQLITALHDAADASARRARFDDRFDQWRALYSRIFGPHSSSNRDWVEPLAERYGAEPADGRTLLFAIHTGYALVVKAVAARAIASVSGPISTRRSRLACQRLESDATWATHGVTNFLSGDIFDWYLSAWTPDLDEATATLFDCLRTFNPGRTPTRHDIFRPLYRALLPGSVRHDLGEFYTPRWLADWTLHRVGYEGEPDRRVLDPACGSGTFVMAALRRLRDHFGSDKDDVRDFAKAALNGITGFDINPLAVLAARANMLCAVADGLEPDNAVELPIYCCDALPPAGTIDLFDPGDTRPNIEPADLVVGNPPWIHWEHLPDDVRRRTKPLWQNYGLFSLSGTAGRLGGGKKDLSMLFTYACCDEYLKPGGRLGFLITASVFKSSGAGDGFRRFRYESNGKTIYLNPVQIDDFTELQPFSTATTQTALICVEKSMTPFDYPVAFDVWTADDTDEQFDITSTARPRESLNLLHRAARPVEPDRPTSPWLTAAPEVLDGIVKVVNDSDYTAYEGVNSGGLNGCYWVRAIESHDDGTTLIENLADVGHIDVPRVRRNIESSRLYPLLRSGDLDRWNASPRCHIVLGQDPETRCGIPEHQMAAEFPRTYRYFQRFEGDRRQPTRGTLRGRSLFRRYYDPDDPYYSMYGVGPYTMRPWKVCWTRIDTRLRAAVLGPVDDRPVLPQETITFVPFDEPDEAHYFCALFNSSPADALVRCYSMGKGFASAHLLDTVGIPQFDDTELHRRLVELSRQCHRAAGDEDRRAIVEIESKIDSLAARIWGLQSDQLSSIRHFLDR